MKLIDKDALVAEIERRIDELYDLLPDASKVENGSITMSEACNTGKYTALESFRRFIDTLEVKEVELTWEDVREICDITFEEACRLQRNMKGSLIYKEQHYTEVLKRFKAQKGE